MRVLVLLILKIRCPRNNQQKISRVSRESRTGRKYIAITESLLTVNRIITKVMDTQGDWGHLVPGNETVGRPSKPCELTTIIIIIIILIIIIIMKKLMMMMMMMMMMVMMMIILIIKTTMILVIIMIMIQRWE